VVVLPAVRYRRLAGRTYCRS